MPLKLPDTGSSVDTHVGHHGQPGLDNTTVLGQDFLFAIALQTALTRSNMARTKSKWDNDDYILLSLLFFFHINVSVNKRKTPSACGTVTFLFFFFSKFGFLCFYDLLIYWYDVILQF